MRKMTNDKYTVVIKRKKIELLRNGEKDVLEIMYKYDDVVCAQFHPNGDYIAIKFSNGKFIICSLAECQITATFGRANHIAQEEGFSYSKDGSLLYDIECPEYDLKKRLNVYRTDTYQKIATLFEYDENVGLSMIATGTDGEVYVAGGVTKQFIGKLDGLKLVNCYEIKNEKQFNKVESAYYFKRNKSRSETFEQIWNKLDKSDREPFDPLEEIFDEDGMLMTWGSIESKKYNVRLRGDRIYVYEKPSLLYAVFSDCAFVYKGVISPDENMLVAKSWDGTLLFYSLVSKELIKVIKGQKGLYTMGGLCFSRDGKYLYNVGDDDECGVLQLFDMNMMRVVNESMLDEEYDVIAIEYSIEDDELYVLAECDDYFSGGVIIKLDGAKNSAKKVSDDELVLLSDYIIAREHGYTDMISTIYDFPKDYRKDILCNAWRKKNRIL